MPGLNCGIGCSAAQPVCNASITGCADFYACQFPAMIESWMTNWNGGSATNGGRPKPFLFVELAPYTEGAGEPHDTSVSAVREAQMAALKLPLVGMAAAYDYGDPFSPLGNIHPQYKAPVGMRLSLAARALAYREKSLAYKNPKFVSATKVDQTTIQLTFDVDVELRVSSQAICLLLVVHGLILRDCLCLQTPPNGGCPGLMHVKGFLANQCAWLT